MRRDRGQIEADFKRVLELFPVLAERRRGAAGKLSGGEQQMLVIGRALLTNPRIMTIDEPSLGLAPNLVDRVYEVLLELRESRGLTLLIVEQSSERALRAADRIYVLRSGEIQLEGDAAGPAGRREGPPSLLRFHRGGGAHRRGGILMEIVVQTIISSLSLGSFYALGALGIGLLFGVLRLINFAHGDFIAVGGFSLIVPATAVVAIPLLLDFHPVLLIICVVGVVIVWALASYFLLFRHIQTAPPAVLMIASVALSFSIQNLIIMIYSGRPKAVGLWPELTGVIELSGKLQVPILQLVIVAVTWILLILLTLFLRRTPIGVEMRAAAEDFRMARMLGVNATRVIALAFVISGALAGIMALMYHTQTGILNFRGGVFLMLYAFIATVIGGMGSLIGAVVGGYVVGIVSTVLIAVLPEGMRGFRDAFVFGLVVVILLARPQGLVPTRAFKERV